MEIYCFSRGSVWHFSEKRWKVGQSLMVLAIMTIGPLAYALLGPEVPTNEGKTLYKLCGTVAFSLMWMLYSGLALKLGDRRMVFSTGEPTPEALRFRFDLAFGLFAASLLSLVGTMVWLAYAVTDWWLPTAVCSLLYGGFAGIRIIKFPREQE